MSFQVNETELRKVYFNNQKVNAVYYNNVLVWEAPLDLQTISWNGLKEICEDVRAGRDTWPEYVKEGAIKQLNLSTSVFGTKIMYAEIIGIDVDGPGTLTFQIFSDGYTIDNSSEKVGAFGLVAFTALDNYSGEADVNPTNWMTSDVRRYCQDIYNYCDAKDAIKPVKKATVLPVEGSYDVPVINEETVWLLSPYETGLTRYVDNYGTPSHEWIGTIQSTYIEETGEYSEPYSYCATTGYISTYEYEDNLIHYRPDRSWLRSPDYHDSGHYYTGCRTFYYDRTPSYPFSGTYMYETNNTRDLYESATIAPCFVIG